jgi:hypothetical protein
MRRRTPRFAPALVLVALALAAAVFPMAPAPAAGKDLPPPSLAKLKKLFKADVKPLGLRVTRGMLQNLETYQEDPEGTHLALYVEPIDSDYSNADYLENFTKLTHEFVPAVFKRWKDLESFDICQEPIDDPRDVPPPTTQIFVTRNALDRVGKWKKADLTELLAASPRARNISAGYYVFFSPALREDPDFIEAATEAGWTTGTTAIGH